MSSNGFKRVIISALSCFIIMFPFVIHIRASVFLPTGHPKTHAECMVPPRTKKEAKQQKILGYGESNPGLVSYSS